MVCVVESVDLFGD